MDKKRFISGVSLAIGFFIMIFGLCWLSTKQSDKWIGHIAYCDRVAGNNRKGTVIDEDKDCVYLDNVKWQCRIGCKCDEYFCDQNSPYEYKKWYDEEEEYFKIQKKSDCYIKGNLETLRNYYERENEE